MRVEINYAQVVQSIICIVLACLAVKMQSYGLAVASAFVGSIRGKGTDRHGRKIEL